MQINAFSRVYSASDVIVTMSTGDKGSLSYSLVLTTWRSVTKFGGKQEVQMSPTASSLGRQI